MQAESTLSKILPPILAKKIQSMIISSLQHQFIFAYYTSTMLNALAYLSIMPQIMLLRSLQVYCIGSASH